MRELTVTDIMQQAEARGRPVNRRTATGACQSGALKARKVGGLARRGTWLVEARSAERWLAEWVKRA